MSEHLRSRFKPAHSRNICNTVTLLSAKRSSRKRRARALWPDLSRSKDTARARLNASEHHSRLRVLQCYKCYQEGPR